MGRTLRYLPRPGAVVEISQRTLQGRFLLKPSERLNALVVGCLARAQKHTGASVHAVAVLSNHFHLLASFDTVEQMSTFACHLKTNLSKEVGRLRDWEGPLFAGRYHSVPLSDEAPIQLQRLKYLLSQGAKEGLVLSPRDWPGVQSTDALLGGHTLDGVWVDRTGLYKARQRGESVREADFTSQESLQLTPMPCLATLDRGAQRRAVEEIVDEIEAETRARHLRDGTRPAGAAAVLGRSPWDRAKESPSSRKPHFHATGRVLRRMLAAFGAFTESYRAAAERLKDGDRGVSFPENCFPPRLPFVPPSRGDWSLIP